MFLLSEGMLPAVMSRLTERQRLQNEIQKLQWEALQLVALDVLRRTGVDVAAGGYEINIGERGVITARKDGAPVELVERVDIAGAVAAAAELVAAKDGRKAA